MSLTGKLQQAGLWQSFQTTAQVAAQFAYTAVMARLLSKSDFGLMAIAGSLIAFGMLFSEAGMGAALIQKKDTSQKHHDAAFQSSLVLGLMVFLIFYVSAQPIAIFFNQPALELIVKIIGITIVLNSLSNISVSLLQKHFRFRLTSLISTATTIAGYGTGIILGVNGWGIWSLVAATVIRSVLNTALLLYVAPFKFSLKFYAGEWKELFSFGSGIILLKINNFLGSQGINLVLGRIFLPAQLGVFERSNQIKNLPGGYLGNVLDTIMFPAMAEIQDEKERLFRIYQYSLGIVNTMLVPLAAYLIFFSKEVVLILLGDKWMDAVLPLQIMFLILPFSTSSRMADSVIRAKGLIYKNVKRKFLYVCTLFTLASLGGHYFGVVGAAAGVTVSYLFNYIIMLFLVQRIFDKTPKEIFMQPVMSGIKLTFFVLPAAVFLALAFRSLHVGATVGFLAVSIIMGILFITLIYKKPSIFGEYLSELAYHLFKQKSKRQNRYPGRAGFIERSINIQSA